MSPICTCVWGWPFGIGQPIWEPICIRNWLSPSQQPLTSSNSSPRSRNMWNFLHPCWNVSWCSYVVLFRQHIVESSHFACRVLGRLSSSRHPGPSALRTFSPSLQCSLSLMCRDQFADVSDAIIVNLCSILKFLVIKCFFIANLCF